MKKPETVTALLDIEMFVTCPNEECKNYINLLREDDTDGTNHDDDGYLLRQMFPKIGSHDDFECKDVTCGECKTTFNVKGLEY